MQRWVPLFLLIGFLCLLLTACASESGREPDSVLAAELPPVTRPTKLVESEAVLSETAARPQAQTACPVTQPPETPFIPPTPWPPQPPDEHRFWFGDNELWTALPRTGNWRQLALGDKFWWWSEAFDVAEEPMPALTVTARRLDGAAPAFQVSQATNGYHSSFHWAMLHGVQVGPGCWEFTGEYKGHQLTFVLWVPPQ